MVLDAERLYSTDHVVVLDLNTVVDEQGVDERLPLAQRLKNITVTAEMQEDNVADQLRDKGKLLVILELFLDPRGEFWYIKLLLGISLSLGDDANH